MQNKLRFYFISSIYLQLIVEMKLKKSFKNHKRLRKIFKTDPISGVQISYEEQSSIYTAKKYLEELNKSESQNYSSPLRNRNLKSQFDLTLAEWNDNIQQEVQFEPSDLINLPKNTGSKFFRNQRQYNSPQKRFIEQKQKYNFVTTRFNKSNIFMANRRHSFRLATQPQNRSACNSLQKVKLNHAEPKCTITINNININLRPIDQNQSIEKIEINVEKTDQLQRQKTLSQKLPRLERLHSNQFKNKLNYIFRTSKPRKFQISEHSPLCLQINKINELIGSQNIQIAKLKIHT